MEDTEEQQPVQMVERQHTIREVLVVVEEDIVQTPMVLGHHLVQVDMV
jgi:hypothetical protein